MAEEKRNPRDKSQKKGEAPKNAASVEMTVDLDQAMKKFEHLRIYVNEYKKSGKQFKFVPKLDRSLGSDNMPNYLYPVGDPIFIHVHRDGQETNYTVIEPTLSEKEEKLYEQILDKIIDVGYREPVPEKVVDIKDVLLKLFESVINVGGEQNFIEKMTSPKIALTQAEYDKIKYYLIRDRIGYGKLEPLFYDPNLEDIHCTGVGTLKAIHKVFKMIYTSIEFKDDNALNKYISEVTERVERPASDARPVIDSIMPDGSRANFIYGREISLEGSSFTLRKFSSVPVSITQVINWGTMSSELAAYLWIALENGMNLFVCGETASGKTTTLNAMCAFMKPVDKVYTVENTPEVTMPHDVWQHLMTREAGKSSDVTYLDLLIAALRSRPNYIIVGEIRGAEGAIAFQAMQTGHPVMSTFHAGNVTTMVQRITGDPINVPITFVDNLNLCLIQQAVSHGGKFVRRVLSLTELERYYEPAHKMITREVFSWNSINDKHLFRGLFNSYILEQKIAKMLGYEDPRQIYSMMDRRRQILDRMIEEEIFDYFEVWEVLKKYYYGGEEALPFKI